MRLQGSLAEIGPVGGTRRRGGRVQRRQELGRWVRAVESCLQADSN